LFLSLGRYCKRLYALKKEAMNNSFSCLIYDSRYPDLNLYTTFTACLLFQTLGMMWIPEFGCG